MAKYARMLPGSAVVELDLDPDFLDTVSEAWLSMLIYVPSSAQAALTSAVTSQNIPFSDNFGLRIRKTGANYFWNKSSTDFDQVIFDAWVPMEWHTMAGSTTVNVIYNNGTPFNVTIIAPTGINFVSAESMLLTGSDSTDWVGIDELAYSLTDYVSVDGPYAMWAFESTDPLGEASANWPDPPWDSVNAGDITITTAASGAETADIPPGSAPTTDVTTSPGPGRVLIALTGGPLDPEPTWTAYDEGITNLTCYGYDCYAGRQSEFDTTDTGNATVYFHDMANVLDDDDLIGLQILLQIHDPVTDTWHRRWRGHIDDIQHDLVDIPKGIPLGAVAVTAVGIFDYLGGVKFLPGVMGDAVPAGMTGIVFYEDEPVNDRVIALMADAGIDTLMEVHTSGNVDVNETLYDPDDVILQGLRDTADAEFPGGVANFYEDRFGRAVWHGRFARFAPEGTAADIPGLWDFTRWDAATREDVTAGVAQIREFSFNRPRARIINSYLAWPREDENGVEFDRSLIPTLLKTAPTSIAAYGYHGDDAPDLIIRAHKTNGNTGADECEIFAQFYVTNYAQPRKAVQKVTFMSLGPTDARAAATWDLMCRCDISDVINLTIDEAGLAAAAFFVDGVQVELRVANPAYDIVTVTPNLTPADYYGDVPDEL